jgi:hypothetical protein
MIVSGDENSPVDRLAVVGDDMDGFLGIMRVGENDLDPRYLGYLGRNLPAYLGNIPACSTLELG